jgi:hypothetical protein
VAEQRPDYVPPTWSRGRLNDWAASRPQRVVGFFVLTLLLAAVLVVWAASDPDGFFSHPRGFVAVIAVPVLVVQAAIYIPRALRASRRR